MATLQKIRNRGGVLVSIVIGLALVAFIVGDALSSGASLINRSRNKVGEVGGETIGIQEYQQKIMKNEDFIKSMNGLSALTDEQQRMIRENTWNQIVSEIILNKEYEELGLDVSGDELYDFLLGRQRKSSSDHQTIDRSSCRHPAKGILVEHGRASKHGS